MNSRKLFKAKRLLSRVPGAEISEDKVRRALLLAGVKRPSAELIASLLPAPPPKVIKRKPAAKKATAPNAKAAPKTKPLSKRPAAKKAAPKAE